MALKCKKSTAISLLVSIFSAADALSHEARGSTSQKKASEALLKQEDIDLTLPLEITTADEYIQLYSAAFNAASMQRAAIYSTDYTTYRVRIANGHTVEPPDVPSMQDINKTAKKLISYMDGQGAVKIAPTLPNMIH